MSAAAGNKPIFSLLTFRNKLQFERTPKLPNILCPPARTAQSFRLPTATFTHPSLELYLDRTRRGIAQARNDDQLAPAVLEASPSIFFEIQGVGYKRASFRGSAFCQHDLVLCGRLESQQQQSFSKLVIFFNAWRQPSYVWKSSRPYSNSTLAADYSFGLSTTRYGHPIPV